MQITAAQCPQCGANLNFDCPRNVDIPGISVNCYFCGTPFIIQQPEPVPVEVKSCDRKLPVGRRKERKIAVLCALVGGMFGLNWFYEEKIVIGLVYLFTAGFFGIGWLVSIVYSLSRPKTYYVQSNLGKILKQIEKAGNINA
jgi:hypothetical protein